MERGKAAVVTLNDRLATLLRAELEICGCEVTVSGGNLPSAAYDFVIVDADTVMSAQLEHRWVTVTLSSRCATSVFTEPYALSSPVRLSDIDALYTSIMSSGMAVGRKSAEDANTVYVIDPCAYTVRIENSFVRLTKTEFLLLEALCESTDEPVSRERIIEILGDSDGNKADVYICHLRKKLERPSGKRMIFTERGKGYRTSLILRG